MIGIEINGVFLTLYPDTQIQITEDNDYYTGGDPLFQLSPRSIPFNIPTQPNQVVLLQSHIPASEYAFRYFEGVNLYAGDGLSIGSVLHVGTLYIRESDNDTTQVFFVASQPEISDKKFVDFDFGQIFLADSTAYDQIIYMYNESSEHPLDYPFAVFPVNNTYLHGDLLPEEKELNPYREWQNWYNSDIKTFRPRSAEYEDYYMPCTPFVRVNYLIEKIGEKLNFHIENLIQTIDEFKLLYLYHNNDINLKYVPEGELLPGDLWPGEFSLLDIIPGRERPMIEFLKIFAKLFCSGIFPDQIERKLWIIPYRDILEAPHEFDFTGKTISTPKVKMENNHPSEIRFKEDSDDDLFDKNQHVNLEDYGFGNPDYYLALSLPSSDGFYYIVNEDRYIKIDDSAEVFNKQFFDIVKTQNTKGRSLELEGAPLFQGEIFPMIRALSTKNIYNADHDAAGLHYTTFRFMLYRGITTAFSSYWPFASNNAYDPDTLSEAYAYSLIFNGEKGIYKSWWEKWMLFLKDQKLVKLNFQLSISDLLNLKPWHKVLAGSDIYLIKSKSYTITMTGISTTECTLIRCN